MGLPLNITKADAKKILGIEDDRKLAEVFKKHKIRGYRMGKGPAHFYPRGRILQLARHFAEKARREEIEFALAAEAAKRPAPAERELPKSAPTAATIVTTGQITSRAFKMFGQENCDLAEVAIELQITGEEVEDLFLTWWKLKQRTQAWHAGPPPSSTVQAPVIVVEPEPAPSGVIAIEPPPPKAANDARPRFTQAEYLARWKKEQEEWRAISEELAAAQGEVTPYQVTIEQRKRALARGETLLTEEDLKAIGG